MMIKIIGLFLVSLISTSYGQSITNCSFTVGSNTIDLSQYTKTSPDSYQYVSPKTNFTYNLNICAAASTCTTKSADPGSGICQTNIATPPVTYSFGQFATRSFTSLSDSSEQGQQMVYNGDPAKKCTGSSTGRSSYFNFICSTSVTTLEIDSILEPNQPGGTPCQLTVNINIPCGLKSGIGGGWITIIIFFSVIAAYIIIGSLVNWKIRHQHGHEIFPNVHFWRNFGSLIRDGVYFIKSKVTGTPHTSGGTYNQI